MVVTDMGGPMNGVCFVVIVYCSSPAEVDAGGSGGATGATVTTDGAGGLEIGGGLGGSKVVVFPDGSLMMMEDADPLWSPNE